MSSFEGGQAVRQTSTGYLGTINQMPSPEFVERFGRGHYRVRWVGSGTFSWVSCSDLEPCPIRRVKGEFHTALAAAKAYAAEQGIAGRAGGWIYNTAGQPICQGWDAYATIARRHGSIKRIENGRWAINRPTYHYICSRRWDDAALARGCRNIEWADTQATSPCPQCGVAGDRTTDPSKGGAA